MKRLYILIIVTLVFLLGMTFNSTRALVWEDDEQVAYRSENLLRLHILANSSSPEDQYLKRQVRDLILIETGKFFRNVDNVETAIQVTSTNLPTLQKKVEDYLRIQGKNIAVKLELGRFKFPTRTYENVTLPAGEYQALKVCLGEAEGNNWWCVLFPPLCLDNEKEVSGSESGQYMALAFSPEESELKIEYRLKFLEILEDVPQWVKANYLNVLRVALMGSNGVVLP